jgi:tetratricopeptide (TPR) repeat protein
MRQGHRLLSKNQHRKIGSALFNHVWDLMEKKSRTREEDAEMIRDVHAMRFHWGEAGTPVNFAVAEWQIARVYSMLGMPESALYHAKKSIACVRSGGEEFEDFHLPSSYEGLARAHSAAGDRQNAQRYLERAKRLASKIKNPEDRKVVQGQIASVSLPHMRRRTHSRTTRKLSTGNR